MHNLIKLNNHTFLFAKCKFSKPFSISMLEPLTNCNYYGKQLQNTWFFPVVRFIYVYFLYILFHFFAVQNATKKTARLCKAVTWFQCIFMFDFPLEIVLRIGLVAFCDFATLTPKWFELCYYDFSFGAICPIDSVSDSVLLFLVLYIRAWYVQVNG